jgi:hypothetical protein
MAWPLTRYLELDKVVSKALRRIFKRVAVDTTVVGTELSCDRTKKTLEALEALDYDC